MAQSTSRSQRILKIYRVPEIMVLFLFIHLLTLQVGEASIGHNHTEILNKNPSNITLKEITIIGSKNNTLITANVTMRDPSRIGNQSFSLLPLESKIQKRQSKQILNSDQDADQSRDVIINMNDEEDVDVVAKYEPQKITLGKAAKKPVDISNNTHDINVTKRESTTGFERTYHEILRNISRNMPQLMLNNTDVTLNPYLTQSPKNLKQIYNPEALLHTGIKKMQFNVSSSSPILIKKKPQKFTKKYYLQPHHAITISPVLSVEKLQSDEKIIDSDESIIPKKYPQISDEKLEPKNASASGSLSRIYSSPSRKLNIYDPLTQIVPPFTLKLNNSDDVSTVNNFNKEHINFPNVDNIIRLSRRYKITPRSFVVPQLLNTRNPINTPNLQISRGKPDSSSIDLGQMTTSPLEKIHSLILPTNPSNSPLSSIIHHRIPTRYANQFDLNDNGSIIANTDASTTPAGVILTGRSFLEELNTDYVTPHTDVIGTTSGIPLPVNGYRRSDSSDYYTITTGNPVMKRMKTNSPAVYLPSRETSSLYGFIQRQNNPRIIYKNGFVPSTTTTVNAYVSSENARSTSSANPDFTYYNNIAKLYFPKLPHLPTAIIQDYQDFKKAIAPSHTVTSQQISPPIPLVTRTTDSPTLLKIQPITSAKSFAPYHDSKTMISMQDADSKELSDNERNEEGSVEIKEQFKDTDEETDDDTNESENSKASMNYQRDYNIYKTPYEQREKTEREQDHYQKQRHDYEQYKHRINDGDGERYENSHHQNNEDEEENVEEGEDDDDDDVEATQENKRLNTGGKKRKYLQRDYDHQWYKSREHDRDDELEDDEGNNAERYNNRKKYNKQKDNFIKYRQGVSNDKYYSKDHKENKEEDRYNRKKGRHDHRKRHEDHEANVAQDPYVRKHDSRYDKRDNDGNIVQISKYHHRIIPPRDHEERSETNPKDIREIYRNHHRDHPRHKSNDQNNNDKQRIHDHVYDETQEHAHKHQKEHHEAKKNDDKKDDHEFEEGKGAEHEEQHHGNEGDKGHKGYKIWHEHEKAEKGHHDKEHAHNEYDEEDGEKKKHEDEDGYHEEHHHGEKGEKAAEFGEKGEHKKGHSTKGEHTVHKKDEYEKKTEFFDESHDDGGIEKHGEYHQEHESKKGGHEKKGHHDEADHKDEHGKKGKYEKGRHHHEHKGDKIGEGHDHHHDHEENYGKKKGHEQGKKWTFKKGDEGGKKSDGS